MANDAIYVWKGKPVNVHKRVVAISDYGENYFAPGDLIGTLDTGMVFTNLLPSSYNQHEVGFDDLYTISNVVPISVHVKNHGYVAEACVVLVNTTMTMEYPEAGSGGGGQPGTGILPFTPLNNFGTPELTVNLYSYLVEVLDSLKAKNVSSFNTRNFAYIKDDFYGNRVGLRVVKDDVKTLNNLGVELATKLKKEDWVWFYDTTGLKTGNTKKDYIGSAMATNGPLPSSAILIQDKVDTALKLTYVQLLTSAFEPTIATVPII